MMFAFFSNILIFFKNLFSKKKTKRTRIHPSHPITRSEMSEILVRFGLTYKQLSIELGVSEDTLSKWLRREKIPDRSWLHLQKLQKSLNSTSEKAKDVKLIEPPKQLALVGLSEQIPKLSTQKCSSCSRELALTEFHKDSTRITGIKTTCKDCSKKYSRNRYHRIKQKEIITESDLAEEARIAKSAELSTLVKKFKGSKYVNKGVL